MYAKILVALEDKYFAAEFFRALDQLLDCDEPATIGLRLVHVIEPMRKQLSWPNDTYIEEAKSLLSEVGHELRQRYANITLEEILLEGQAAESIIDDAIDNAVDLIITGAHGRRGPSRFFLGSVASKIACFAPCSVLVVRPGAAAQK